MQQYTYGIHRSAFGPMVVAVGPSGVRVAAFIARATNAAAVRMVREYVPVSEAVLRRSDRATTTAFRAVLARTCTAALAPRGTPFQLRVWKALRAIPYGRTATYADIARSIGKPGASRAVGAACGKNPIAVTIPCHRILPASGNALGGYRWGVAIKTALLAAEGALPKPPKKTTVHARAWEVYMARCADGTLYTGIATNATARITTHNTGKGAKYTRARLPVTLVWKEPAADRSAALRREISLKKRTRKEKEALVVLYSGNQE